MAMPEKIAVITGAGSGIGRASALALLEVGFAVVLAGRRRAMLEETAALAKAPPPRTLIVPTNVADSGSIALPVSGSHACYNIYRTSDDRYVALGALEPKFWSAFCDRIGRRDLVPLQYIRGEAQARALDEIRALMQTRSQADWLALFRDVDVCLTPVLSVADALSDPHFLERGVVARYGGCTYVTSPIAIGSSSKRLPRERTAVFGAESSITRAFEGLDDLDAGDGLTLHKIGA